MHVMLNGLVMGPPVIFYDVRPNHSHAQYEFGGSTGAESLVLVIYSFIICFVFFHLLIYLFIYSVILLYDRRRWQGMG
jgi:hypothetical protein